MACSPTALGRQHRPPLILVVDDQDDLRGLCRSWLEQWGFDALEARDGLEALTQARTAAPTLIVMDFSMPRMDGLDAVRQFHSRPDTADIPVIGVTGDGRSTGRGREFAAECDAFLAKPTDPDALLHEIRRLLPADA